MGEWKKTPVQIKRKRFSIFLGGIYGGPQRSVGRREVVTGWDLSLGRSGDGEELTVKRERPGYQGGTVPIRKGGGGGIDCPMVKRVFVRGKRNTI